MPIFQVLWIPFPKMTIKVRNKIQKRNFGVYKEKSSTVFIVFIHGEKLNIFLTDSELL